MQKEHTHTLIPALEKERWIFVKVNVNNRHYEMLTKAVSPFLKELKSQKKISDFLYRIDGNNENYIMFCFKSTLYNSEHFIKQQFKSIIENELNAMLTSIPPVLSTSDFYKKKSGSPATFEYLDFYVFEYIQLYHDAEVSKILMPSSSEIIMEIMNNEEEWNYETVLDKGLALHLIFGHCFGLKDNELSMYFEHFFNAEFELLDKETLNGQEETFVKNLEENFEAQAENLKAYCDYLLTGLIDNDEFEDDWINDWAVYCKKAALKFQELKNNNLLNPAIKPLVSEKLTEEQKNDWAHLMYYSNFIDNQLLLGPGFSLILSFTLSNSLKK